MLASLIPALLPIVGDVLDRFFPNKEEKEKATREIEAKLTEHLASGHRATPPASFSISSAMTAAARIPW